MTGDDGTRCGSEHNSSTAPGHGRAVLVVEGVDSDGVSVTGEYELNQSDHMEQSAKAKFRDEHGWGRFETINILGAKRPDDTSRSQNESHGQNWDF